MRSARKLYRLHILLIIVLVVILVFEGCSPAVGGSADNGRTKVEKTEQITFPSSYVKNFFYDEKVTTSKAVAKSLASLGDKYYTAARGEKDGSVTVTVTEKQRVNNIKANQKQIDIYAEKFLKSDPDYRYKINEDGTQFDIWFDNKLNFDGTNFFTVAPAYSGYNYYLKRHTGDWSILIKAYNCHTNQLIHQYTKPGETWDFKLEELGD